MSKTTTWKCDLCRQQVRPEFLGMPGSAPEYHDVGAQLIGLHCVAQGQVLMRPPDDDNAALHICARCWSSIGRLKTTCGQGYWDCRGGPECGSDHK
jgi:hypothetical protein